VEEREAVSEVTEDVMEVTEDTEEVMEVTEDTEVDLDAKEADGATVDKAIKNIPSNAEETLPCLNTHLLIE
jgi:uncharacterized protein YoxC